MNNPGQGERLLFLFPWMLNHPAVNRRMRTRMSGGVGRAGETPALTRLGRAQIARIKDYNYNVV